MAGNMRDSECSLLATARVSRTNSSLTVAQFVEHNRISRNYLSLSSEDWRGRLRTDTASTAQTGLWKIRPASCQHTSYEPVSVPYACGMLKSVHEYIGDELNFQVQDFH